MKYKELKRENKKLNQKLNMANKTVHDLMQEIDRAINKQHEQHESQMQVAENEIRRLNTIIDFLYMRGRE